MAILSTSLGDIGRVGLLKVFRIEAEKFPDTVGLALGNEFATKQSYERFKSLVGLNLPGTFGEAQYIPTDDPRSLFTQNFYPFKVATAVEFSYEVKWVDRYNQIATLQQQLALQFLLKKNIVAWNLYNTGFTATNLGMNNESLFSTSHANGDVTGSNRPAIDIALGPLAIAQAKSELRQQKSARGQVMPYMGSYEVFYPYALEGTAYALAESDKSPGSNINDKNFAKVSMRYTMVDYLTSMQAWFMRMSDNNRQKLFWLDQIPYDIIDLPINQQMMYVYIAFQTYVAGWCDWHGTWGTTGG